MARTLDGVNDDIRFGIGQLAQPTAFTIAAMVKRGANDAWHNILSVGNWANAGSNPEYWLEITNLNLIQLGCLTNGTSAPPSPSFTTADGWSIVGAGKAAGASTPRHHKYVVSSNSWTHAPGTATVGDPDQVSDAIRVGSWRDNDFWNGDIAWVAVWKRNLSDAEFELLAGGRVSILSTAPDCFAILDQQVTSMLVKDEVGGASQTAITGTTVATASVPGFNYGAPILGPTFVPATAGTVSPPSLVRTRALGSPQVNPTLKPASLERTRALGSPTIVLFVKPASLERVRALGSPQANPTLKPAGLDHARALGSPQVNPTLKSAGLDHGRALGSPAVAAANALLPAGLARTRALGTPQLNIKLFPAGLDHLRALGVPSIPSADAGFSTRHTGRYIKR